MADCDLAIKLKPGDPSTLESRALVLYQQGKYQDALSAYDAVLAINPRQASALLLRGYTKAKLGDQTGMAADIAAAKAANSAVEAQLLALDISG
jgi:tetratricopeptide (TPR) repeat protein